MRDEPLPRSRLGAYGAVSTALALCGDRRLRELVDGGEAVGAGIGGRTVLLDIGGTPVFVKQVRLTDLERRRENLHSTANMFALPVHCQYGYGTPGFGAWRELAAHTMTTNWVIAGEHQGFPLMYHWRVLPGPAQPLPDELADVDRAVASWGGGPGVRRRIEELRDASASLMLFLEYVPRNLHDWLRGRVAAGGDVAERALALVERELAAGTSFMNARGLLHFDAHFENILTDGRRLYFADFGLALSSRFELARDEAEFFARHHAYDRSYTATHLVNWLVVELFGYAPDERQAYVRALAEGGPTGSVPPAVAALLTRHASVAAVMGDFSRAFRAGRRTTPFPAEAIRRIEQRGSGEGLPA